MKVTLHKHEFLPGKSKWVVAYREGGKRRRTFWISKTTGQAEVARLRSHFAEAGSGWVDLPAGERSKLIEAWQEAQRKGMDLLAMVRSPATTTTTKSPAIEDVLTEMEAVKREAGRDEDYVRTLHNLMAEFCQGRERLPIAQFTVREVETFMRSKNIAYRPTLRSRLSTFFQFAVRRGYLLANPCNQLESVTTPHVPPAILTLEETRKALAWLRANPRWLGWFALSTLAGLRPEEAANTQWSAINLDEGSITVEAQTSKMRQRRVVYPQPMALDWLREARRLKSKLPLTDGSRRIGIRQLRNVLGWKNWKSDVTRHSAASYWLAACGSAATVATALGHAESVLRKNYMALVTKAEAEQFWGLTPRVVGGPNPQP